MMANKISQFEACREYVKECREFRAPNLRGVTSGYSLLGDDSDTYYVIHYSTTIAECVDGAWIMNETNYSSLTGRLQNLLRRYVWTPKEYEDDVVHLYNIPIGSVELLHYMQGRKIAVARLKRNMVGVDA